MIIVAGQYTYDSSNIIELINAFIDQDRQKYFIGLFTILLGTGGLLSLFLNRWAEVNFIEPLSEVAEKIRAVAKKDQKQQAGNDDPGAEPIIAAEEVEKSTAEATEGDEGELMTESSILPTGKALRLQGRRSSLGGNLVVPIDALQGGNSSMDNPKKNT